MPKAKPAPVVVETPKPVRPQDNGEKAAFNALCALPRVALCEAMLATEPGTPAKDKAKAAYVAYCEVAITANAGRGWEPGLADQLVALQTTIDEINHANRSAVTQYAGLNGTVGAALLDRTDLTVWLLDRLAETERDLQDAMKTRPAFVRMSTPVLAPAKTAPKAVRHEVDLGPLNEAPPVVHKPGPVPVHEPRRRPRPPRT